MAIDHLNSFLQKYFQSHHCDVLDNKQGVLRIQLTEEMDKALMNRPFYWHYVNNAGMKGNPMALTLITNPDKRGEKGEWVHFGSPRLQQIIRHLINNEKQTVLFQKIDTHKNVPLHPWLVINMKISYTGRQRKEELHSIGLHLISGKMETEMMEKLSNIPLDLKISDYCYTLSPLIRWKSGFLRIQSVLDNYIENQSHEWAEQSISALREEQDMLNYFYGEAGEDAQKEKEMQEIEERYQPSVSFEVINGGIFYLTENWSKQK
ncbi:YqhG family protein [Virgibacillus xinjiangensis]|uniref:YqhG family protein n=1 Tax=Virgibacillus xinjiangensis TaxID=393090 RepID=A0ABV7CRQ0_9BACI